MRDISNFILFEDIITNLPAGAPNIINVANTLMTPTIPIVEVDCGTALGSISTVGYQIVGQINLSTLSPITTNNISTWLSTGIATIRTRDTSSCISKGGICQVCYQTAPHTGNIALDGSRLLDGSQLLNGYAPGPTATIYSEYIYWTDVITGDGVNSTYPVTQTTAMYDYTNLDIIPNPLVSSLTDTQITFTRVLTKSDVFPLQYYIQSSNPLLEYFAKTYSGGLFGIAPLPSFKLVVKPSVLQGLFSANQLSLMMEDLSVYSANIPPGYLSYCDTIVDNLEKALFIIYLYAVYSSIS